jgi:hypothetical protein
MFITITLFRSKALTGGYQISTPAGSLTKGKELAFNKQSKYGGISSFSAKGFDKLIAKIKPKREFFIFISKILRFKNIDA